jgi:hypothetical protein
MADIKDKAVSGARTVWCSTWTFTQNLARRAKILGRYSLACWQQYKLKKALHKVGEQTYQALERGEANPMVAPEVSEAVQKAKERKDLKAKNYQEIAAIRERIRGSCGIPTPEEPGGVEENPPVP